MMFIKLLIVFGRLVAFWNFADGYKYAMNGNWFPATLKFVLAAWIMFSEANWLVKSIEKE